MRSIQLMATLATVAIVVTAKTISKDSEGNPIGDPIIRKLGAGEFTATLENTNGDFGSIDGAGNFVPGSAGATGEIHVSAIVDNEGHDGAVAVELIPGDASSTETTLEVELTPVSESTTVEVAADGGMTAAAPDPGTVPPAE